MFWMIRTSRTLFVALCAFCLISAQGCSQKRTLINDDGVTNTNLADTDRSISLEEALKRAHVPGIGEGSGEPSDYLYAVKEEADNSAFQNKRDDRTLFSTGEPGVFTPGMGKRHQQLKELGPRSTADVARDFDQMIREGVPNARLVHVDN
jgi:hypothetical protein